MTKVRINEVDLTLIASALVTRASRSTSGGP